MTATGPDFVSFQVRDKDASARFYEEALGMTRVPVPNPHAHAFSDGTTTFAVRDPFAGADLDTVGQLRAGVAVWFHNADAAALHDRLVEQGVPIIQEPVDGPFGVTFTLRDPDGYAVTIHSRA